MKAEVNGIILDFDSVGEGEPVILIHALGGSSDTWWQQVPVLSNAYRVITYDIRGHGRSDKPAGPYSLELFAEDLRGLVAHLGLGRVHLVGVSLGGMIAQAYALAHPDTLHSLVLCDTSSAYLGEQRNVFLQRAAQAEESGLENIVPPTLERWFTEPFRTANPQAIDRVAAVLWANDARAYAATCRAIANLNFTDRLVAVRCPTMVVVGEEDMGTPPEVARVLASAIPGARLEIVPGAAHMLPVEKADVFNALLLDFLPQT